MKLNIFTTDNNLFKATNNLFAQLEITLNSNTAQNLGAKVVLAEHFKDRKPFTNVSETYFAGLVNDEIFNKNNLFDNKISYEEALRKDESCSISIYNGLMIFALKLTTKPSRTEISELTRAFNRKSLAMPVALLLQYDKYISLALPERFLYKQSWRQGERVGKTIILRDIDCEKPHEGHRRILHALADHKAKNFSELHEKWLSVLNINVLNKDFYNKLLNWYQRCYADIQIDLSAASRMLGKDIDNELRPQAVIRVIIRMMFIWFMKEKGLIPKELFEREFARDFLKNENTYYNAVLQNLFFAVLNQKIDERRFRKENPKQPFNPEENEHGVFDVMRFKRYFKDGKAEEFLNETKKIPFVNGGLFACHDYKFTGKDETGEWNKKNNYLIDAFSETKPAQINENVMFELIELFNSYVWTIEESTPDEQDIALDPELLGTIFENLIGFYNPETKENARKQTGSFYTPKEIVDYMCRESFKETLKTRFPDLSADIDNLVENNEGKLDFPDRKKLQEAIKSLKILDPACGSGAFPMGMFNLMVRTIEKLQEHKTTYKNKLDIIQKCIYGVDIQNIAVEISKLRFFISLLVDYPTPNNIADFEVLPNLETKFAVANTLIGIDLTGGDDMFQANFMEECKKLTAIFTPFTTAKTPGQKTKIKNDFETEKQRLLSLLAQNNFMGDEIDKIRAWNPFNVCYCSPFFDSGIMFGHPSGFHIVIGNPPYVQVPKGIFSKKQFPYSEGKDKGKQNLYKVFVESSYNLIKENGIATMIVQSSLMADLSSQYTRELLLTKTQIKEILEFPKKSSNQGGQVFENVLQGTCIYLFKKTIVENNAVFKISIGNDVTTINNLQYENIEQQELIRFYPNGYFIPLLKPNEFQIIRRMWENAVPLINHIIESSQGDLNLTNDKNHFSNIVSNIKLLRGKHLHRYFINYTSDEYIQGDFKSQTVKSNETYKYIVGQNITGTTDRYRLHFAVTNSNEAFLFGHTVDKLRVTNDPNFVLAILNSNLLDWYFRKTSTNNHVNIYEIEQLPIPIPTKEEQQPIISLVTQILDAKRGNPSANTTVLECEIDRLVYQLYGLTEEEIEIIEGKRV